MQSLFTTLLLAGSAIAAPALSIIPRDGKPDSCMSRGSKVSEWTVSEFDYHASYIFTTPSHQVSGGYANFTLENKAVDYKPICSAASSQLSDFFYGTMVYNCEVLAEGGAASFTYSRPSGDLMINQTWSCADEGGRFIAKGGTTLDLDCEDETWENPDWKMGQIYSQRTVTCKKVTVKAPITEISAVL